MKYRKNVKVFVNSDRFYLKVHNKLGKIIKVDKDCYFCYLIKFKDKRYKKYWVTSGEISHEL